MHHARANSQASAKGTDPIGKLSGGKSRMGEGEQSIGMGDCLELDLKDCLPGYDSLHLGELHCVGRSPWAHRHIMQTTDPCWMMTFAPC